MYRLLLGVGYQMKPLIRTCLLLLALLPATLKASQTIGDGGRQVYIVYLGQLPTPDPSSPEPNEAGFSAVEFAHHDLLNQVLDDGSSASDRILRSYKRSLNGFAARLTEQEAEELSNMDSIVSVFPSRTHKLLTTRSWDFLGFPQPPPEELKLEGEIIVGMLDTGVWPDSPSFSDDGFGPPPSRWKGVCQNFTCNNKIIGARAYNQGSSIGVSPLDNDGHGTHTASIVAGREVSNVSFNGLAAGTARGAVPGARLAIYKCGEDCGDADILAGFDDAIADGVDVISISLGDLCPSQYFRDTQAIGSFHAMRRGVVTSAAAGNSGMEGLNAINVAPWILSVAASSIDRRFINKIVLGNGDTIVGISVNTFPTVQNATLVFPTNGSCQRDKLAGGPYKGKIVLCPYQNGKVNDGSGPLSAGAAGAVVVQGAPDVAFVMPLPGLAVTQEQLDEILTYVNNTSNPVGTIDSSETTMDPQAPVAAKFSSPGPNLITAGILKPDLSAPGIDILAAWSPLASPSDDPDDKRKVLYNIMTGTSMACPHASGAAAYVKSFHRDWSPAMIMSALITTATPMDTPANSGSTFLKYGAGQLNPVKARDPGLVYDASESDYVAMLCAQGYNATQLALVTGSNTTACASVSTEASSGSELNYPTMAAQVEPGKNFTVSFPRTVTNVGAASDVYNAKVVLSAKDLAVTVSPNKLEFSEQRQKISFTVTVSSVAPGPGQVLSAVVVWYNDDHEVRSPLVVYGANPHTRCEKFHKRGYTRQ